MKNKIESTLQGHMLAMFDVYGCYYRKEVDKSKDGAHLNEWLCDYGHMQVGGAVSLMGPSFC